MIEPKPLFDYFKSCADSRRVGDVCRALGGQCVRLDDEQSRVVMLVNECMRNNNKAVARSSRHAGGAAW